MEAKRTGPKQTQLVLEDFAGLLTVLQMTRLRRPGIPGKKSGLKYLQLLQSLLSMNQVNILKDTVLSKV